ncbi:MAG: hypothetical protein LH606_01485 [Cytophagaceae bacterium]|nr:hypothetical protein [Cytophagaceae bacterium]
MKSIRNFFVITTIAGAMSVFVSSCQSTDKADTGDKAVKEVNQTMATADAATAEGTEHSGEHTYACPMHPEVTGKEGDLCPKCGMKLEHNDHAGKSNGNTYAMVFKANPGTVEAGKAAMLSFKPTIKGKEGELVPLDVHHEKKMHLIVVSSDLSYFDHIHPDYQASGSYDIAVLPTGKGYTKAANLNETHFDKGGDYLLFADYFPSGANNQIEKINLNVAGKTYTPVTYASPKLTSTTGDYTLTLVPEGGKLEAGKMAHIQGVLTQGGKRLDAAALDNYLGAKAHAVVIGVDDKQYLHVHPEVENGAFDLHTTFEKAGVYRGWIQYLAGGKVNTADFVIVVK